MKLIRRPLNPFKDIEEFFNDQDFWGAVPAVRRHLLPPMDVSQTDKELVVELQIPKVDTDKIDISVEDGVLKVSYEEQEEDEKVEKNYMRREIRYGSFSRSIVLPVDVKEDLVEANYIDGLLKITLPKAEVKAPKKVEVKVKKD